MSKLRVAFLGCGGIAGKHTRSLQVNPDAEIVACGDVSKEIVDKFIEKNLPTYAPRPAVFTDAAEMYKKTRPNAVVICTPHTQHFAQGMQAMEAGCHVLMEKPMVTSVPDAYKIDEAARKLGKVFMVAYNTSCSPEFFYLRQLIRERKLGKLELVNGYISQDWLKLTAGKWRQVPEMSGGGQAYDSGAHLLNSLCWSVESRVAQVSAFIDNCGAAVDINSVINVRFESGVLASICVSGNCPSNGTHMVFIFDNGRVEIDGWSAGWINIFQGKDKVKYPPIPEKALAPADNFIDAILGRDEARTSPRNGIVHSELMAAIYESAKTGRSASPK